MPDTLCLKTTIKNKSGGTRTFGWIPPHGKTLTADQSVTIFGDIWDQLSMGGRGNARRLVTALEADINANRIEIIKSPSLFLYDDTDANVKIVDLDNGTLGIADPCYGSYFGSP